MKKKAVILAAGKSTRTLPLTETRPKPLLYVAGKTILEHNLLNLIKVGVEEVVLVVGYLKEKLIQAVKNFDLPLKYHFVEQKEPLGTAHALKQVKNIGNLDSFLFLMGDDLYPQKDLEVLAKEERAILGFLRDDAFKFGVLEVKEGYLQSITEKPEDIQKGIVNTGAYSLTKEIFSFLDVEPSARGEYEFTTSLDLYAKKFPVRVVLGSRWVPLTYPWSLLEVQRLLFQELKPSHHEEVEIESGATIKGPVHIGKGTIIRGGAYIEGPVWIGSQCIIGPNCYIRPYTTLGDSVKIGNACEVKESIFFPGVKMGHLSYVGDSVIGENVNLGAGTLVANLKHNNKNILTLINGKYIDTGRRKLGAIIGDGAKLGIGTKIYPGRKLWPNTCTMVGEIIKKDCQKTKKLPF